MTLRDFGHGMIEDRTRPAKIMTDLDATVIGKLIPVIKDGAAGYVFDPDNPEGLDKFRKLGSGHGQHIGNAEDLQ